MSKRPDPDKTPKPTDRPRRHEPDPSPDSVPTDPAEKTPAIGDPPSKKIPIPMVEPTPHNPKPTINPPLVVDKDAAVDDQGEAPADKREHNAVDDALQEPAPRPR